MQYQEFRAGRRSDYVPLRRRIQDPRETKISQWESMIKHKYGLGPEDVARMYESQDRKCAICRKDLLLDKRTAIDHCHITGKTRGLLCTGCNTSIGVLKEDFEIMNRAIDYLMRHRIAATPVKE